MKNKLIKRDEKLHREITKEHRKEDKLHKEEEKVHREEDAKNHKGHTKKKDPKPKQRGDKKVEKVMHEFKEGILHSGSKKGPQVTNAKQAIAIALSEKRKDKIKR